MHIFFSVCLYVCKIQSFAVFFFCSAPLAAFTFGLAFVGLLIGCFRFFEFPMSDFSALLAFASKCRTVPIGVFSAVFTAFFAAFAFAFCKTAKKLSV